MSGQVDFPAQSTHFTEAERVLNLVDVSNLPPGDLATVALVHAVLDLSGRLAIALDRLTETVAEGSGT